MTMGHSIKDDEFNNNRNNNDDENEENLLALFEKICLIQGDDDAIVDVRTNTGVCYLELQELSINLACQLQYRYRSDIVVVECLGQAIPEVVTILACLRVGKPFVPLSIMDQHASWTRLAQILAQLKQANFTDQSTAATAAAAVTSSSSTTGAATTAQGQSNQSSHIVAVCCVDNDQDPRLGVLYAADLYSVVYLDPMGNVLEQLRVPSSLPILPWSGLRHEEKDHYHHHLHSNDPSQEEDTVGAIAATTAAAAATDHLYVLFTSGTSGKDPKAVVGSHQSTYRRLQWFRQTFDDNNNDNDDDDNCDSPCLGPKRLRVARKTRLIFVDGITELLGPILSPQSQLLVTWSRGNDYGSATTPPQSEQTMTTTLQPPSPFTAPFDGSNGSVLDVCQVVQRLQPNQITLLPNQLAHLLKTLPAKDLSTLDRILVSGEVFPAWLWEQHIMGPHCKLKPSCRIVNLYGQTESTGDILAVVLNELQQDSETNGTASAVIVNGIVAVGKAILPSIQITKQPITSFSKEEDDDKRNDGNNDDSRDSPQEQEQHLHQILVQGNLSNGYLTDYCFSQGNYKTCENTGVETATNSSNTSARTAAAAAAAAFHAQPFATGDVGFCSDDGIWYIQGRCDEVQKINGILTSPQEIETAFASVYGNNQDASSTMTTTATTMTPPWLGRVAATIVDGAAYLLVEDARIQDSFSRSHMRQVGVPWNLIPQNVFVCHRLPIKALGGAPKLDRLAVKNMVQQQLRTSESDRPKQPEPTTRTTSENTLYSLVARVLSRQSTVPQTSRPTAETVDLSKSFVDLGGDSALAVELLYLLRQYQQQHFVQSEWSEKAAISPNTLHALTATDILQSTNLLKLFEDVMLLPSSSHCDPEQSTSTTRTISGITGKPTNNRKKQKLDEPTASSQKVEPSFQPLDPIHIVPNDHIVVQFSACVDGSPQILSEPFDQLKAKEDEAGNRGAGEEKEKNGFRTSIYAACQGGIVQQICAMTWKVLACRQFIGWMFQADPFVLERGIILCCTRSHCGNCKHSTSPIATGPSPGNDDNEEQQQESDPERVRLMIVALSHNLEEELWCNEFEIATTISGGVDVSVSSPIRVQTQLWTLAKNLIYILDLATGSHCRTLTLVHDYIGTPLLLHQQEQEQEQQQQRADDSSSATTTRQKSSDELSSSSPSTAYPVDVVLCSGPSSLAWIVVSQSGQVLSIEELEHGDHGIGPIYKDPAGYVTQGGEQAVVLADSYGSLHLIVRRPKPPWRQHQQEQQEQQAARLDEVVVSSVQVSSCPLSSPSLVVQGNTIHVIVGSYNGAIYSYRYLLPQEEVIHGSSPSSQEAIWTRFVGASIYATPFIAYSCQLTKQQQQEQRDRGHVDDSYYVVYVVTTAGDILLVDGTNGTVLWRYRISAEIWSNPKVLQLREQDYVTLTRHNEQRASKQQQQQQHKHTTKFVVFGARDSRVHAVRLPFVR